MDFDDLLLQTETLFQKCPQIRQLEAGRFDHVLVDEYQDTNGSQYRIIASLAMEHRNLCVVGDDDQSIYGWRGADVTHILSFGKQWPEAKVVRLEENYRSTGSILGFANRLIAHNHARHDKSLRPQRPDGPPPRILQWKDEAEEAKETVADIARVLARGHYQPQDLAILFRTNEQPRLFETELRKAKVPYTLVGTQSFFDRREVRDVLAMLKWIDQPNDEVSLLRIINTPPRGLGNSAIQGIVKEAVARGVPAYQVMIDPAFAEQLSTAAQRGLAELRAIRETVHESIARDGLADATRKLLERTRYADELARIYTEPEERERRWNSVEELVNAISEYQLGPETNLAGFLAETALSGREFSEKDKGRSRNEVGMYTFHSAKGLEFPVVYMVGMEEGLLPHHRTVRDDEHEVDEERRLCYVGITRAQEQLTLSMALTRRKWGKPRPTQPSRFLYEITGKAENPRKRK
jgi:DNA helicase-2/ATP-dependent DNA helicase PcrA